jgi:signal peptidase II
MKPSLKILLFCFSSLVFIGCDRITKGLAKEHLMNKAPVTFFNNTVRLVYAENTGAAMSFGDGLPKTASFWILGILPLLFLLSLAVYAIMHSRQMGLGKIFALALIVSGGLGNIIDRILHDRHVTDFMIIGNGSVHTGIFNFADVCVTTGAIALLIFYRDKKPAGAPIPNQVDNDIS